MKSWLPLQRSLLSTVTRSSRQLDKWHRIDFAYLGKLPTARITRKYLITLLRNVFVSHCRRDVGISAWEKKIDFSRLNFTFYSVLEKKHFCLKFAIMEKTTNTMPAHTSNSCLPVGQPVIRMLHTLHWLTIRLPGIQLIRRSKY